MPAYNSGGANKNFFIFALVYFSSNSCHLSGISHALLASAGVGITRADNNAADKIGWQSFFAQMDRCSFDFIGGKNPSGRGGEIRKE